MTLRERVLRGGFYLILRLMVGMVISIGGVLLLTRFLGPANYGLYAGALAVVMFLSSLAKFDVNVYLVRREGTPEEEVYHQAFSFLLLSGLGVAALGLLATPLLELWLGDPAFLPPLQVMLLSMPITALYAPAQARLEQALDFRKIAFIELVGQALLYALALPLAYRGFGVWAPVSGYLLWQTWTLVSGYVLARYRPRWYWRRALLREMLGYSSGYAASTRILSLRRLVNPLIVGRFLGAEAVGYVALAIRLVEVMSFVKDASWRLSIVALAKVQRDLTSLRRALEEAMGLQGLAMGPVLAGFALVAPWIVPRVFGDQWDPVLSVYPFIALGYLVNTVFSMHSSVLYVLRRNGAVMAFNAAYVALFVAAALVLVPRFELRGYGLAEVVALLSYVVIHLFVARTFDFSYARAWPWLLAFAPPLFVPLVGLPWGLLLWSGLLAAALSGGARSQVREYWSLVRKRRGSEAPS